MQISFMDLGPKVNLEQIIRAVGEEAVFKYYCSEFPSRLFNSPFRGDATPSFGFYEGSSKWQWKWKDLATGESGNCVDFVMKKFMITFPEALAKIAQDLEITPYQNITYKSVHKERTPKTREPALLRVRGRPFSASDLAYWYQWPITTNILNYYNARVADELWKDDKKLWGYQENDPTFYYFFPLSQHIKGYRPKAPTKKDKWISNVDDNVDIQGYYQCRIKQHPGRPLILTKSMKDIMFFRAFGYNSMAKNGEGYYYNPDFIRHIKKYCHPIISLYDNDAPGIKAANRDRDLYGIVPYIIDTAWAQKDPTDLWLHNYRKAYQLLNHVEELFSTIRSAGIDSGLPTGLFKPEEGQTTILRGEEL
jgi:hypothetical protein